LSRGFSKLFSRNFLGEKHLPLWEFTNPPLDYINIIPHPPRKVNSQNAQNRENYLTKLCTAFLLTNCVECGIIKNSAQGARARAAIIPHLFDFVNRQNVQKIRLIFVQSAE
jgi:hypothetical protein